MAAGTGGRSLLPHAVVILALGVLLTALGIGPFADAPAGATGATGATASGTCRVGTPARLRIPSLRVDAAYERVGLDHSRPADAQGKRPVGAPSAKANAGWYAAGPRPGSGRGTVITTGHTYRNGGAIFTEAFGVEMKPGAAIEVVQDNGSLCRYRVTRVWSEVDAARDYPRIVTSENLYDFSGPERLFVVTCGGRWDSRAREYEDVSFLIAEPEPEPHPAASRTRAD